jgi:hypothetical protein
MKKAFGSLLAGLAVVAFCAAAGAADLPKTGTINWHTGWKGSGEAITVAEGHMQGHGSAVGTSFNDKGSGPLHLGAAECVYTFFASDAGGSNLGYCSFGDADGDRIFTSFEGKVGLPSGYDEGINVITGGTGKYAGISGSGPWKCKGSGANGGMQCRQSLDYKLQ